MISLFGCAGFQSCSDVLANPRGIKVRGSGIDGYIHEFFGFIVQVVLSPRHRGKSRYARMNSGSSWRIVSH